MKRVKRRAVLAAVMALAGAAPALGQELTSGMTPFIPPPPEGWSNAMPPNVVEDENGMEPSVSHGYGPTDLNTRGWLYVVLTRPSPHDMPSRFQSPRPLGPSPFAPQFVVSQIKVNELDGYLSYSAADRGGVLDMKVGRVLVAIQGAEVTPDQILAFARSVDTARLLKY